MRFKIVSVGWNCLPYIEATLASVESQTLDNWDVWIVDDVTEDPAQAEFIREWCDSRDERWNYTINTEKKYVVRNQYEAIELLTPEPDDVIVFLDLDGDYLAHDRVLERLELAYSNGALVTYGNYKPYPDGGKGTVLPFPDQVVREGKYREYIADGNMCINHLRTMSGEIFDAIPQETFRWPSGKWYVSGTDYIYMTAALEKAHGQYECIDDVLLMYNHGNPLADNKTHPADTAKCVQHFLHQRPLPPMPAPVREAVYLDANERREILREYGKQYGLEVLIETGTNRGDTPWVLQGSFREIYTIELDRKLFRMSAGRFKDIPQVHCIYGDSATKLPKILAELDEPTLVWLDGHCSGPGTARGDKDTPVMEELEALFKDSQQHVILVDDARIFKGQPEHKDEPHYADYPTLEWIERLALSWGYHYEMVDDIVRLVPGDLYETV